MAIQHMKYDLIIVGAGVVGLAHAYQANLKGLNTLVIEKEQMAIGASVRNFGMIWPIGQPYGHLFDRAMNSREIWVNLSKKAKFWASESGSIHLAYAKDEWDILEEFHAKSDGHTLLISPKEILKRSANVNPINLIGGLFSSTEVNVNAKQAIHSIASYLQQQQNITFHYGEQVQNIDRTAVQTTHGRYIAHRVLICSGSDFLTLYPEIFRQSPLIKSKLQMLRSKAQPASFTLGPMLCGGLTLRHYASFESCESLEVYRKRIKEESPWFDEWGIHVMASTNESNEIIIGDSHEYGFSFDPFNKQRINDYILNYLNKFLLLPNLEMSETWYGVYAKNPEGTEFVHEVDDSVTIITGFGGAGMTFSFGFAQEFMQNW